jgi:hypothetical protein
MRIRTVALSGLCGLLAFARPADVSPTTFEDHPAITLSNGRLSASILTQGSTIAQIVLSGSPSGNNDKLGPLWNPMRMARELGRTANFNPGIGHFVCVDGFGGTSQEERAAGFPGHGEAHRQMFELQYPDEGNSTATLKMTALLPLVQELFVRTYRLVDGENVLYVESQLENLVSFDRPISWAEHATAGSPWLESGVTVFDVSGTRAQTRKFPQPDPPNSPVQRRFPGGVDFTWPMAPGLNGAAVDMRQTPENPHYRDHTTTLIDPARELGWTTAINPKRREILGYLFRRADYPWLQTWGDYPPTAKMARGMEFGTQPYDVSRRDAVNQGKLFDTPTFRWLPAKAKIETRFVMFYAPVPEGFAKVDDVEWNAANRQIVIHDRKAGKQVTLQASRGI